MFAVWRIFFTVFSTFLTPFKQNLVKTHTTTSRNQLSTHKTTKKYEKEPFKAAVMKRRACWCLELVVFMVLYFLQFFT